LLHGGNNASAFSWRDNGRWHCFSCGAGGDRIALVQAAKQCSFSKAVEFLSALAGVEHCRDALQHSEVKQMQRQRQALRSDAKTLLAAEKQSWLEARDSVLLLEAIRRDASRRLGAIHFGQLELWSGEGEVLWATLAEVHKLMWRTVARYYAISFAPAEERFAYALDNLKLGAAVDGALERGYVSDERGYRFEIQL
jgi:hypothetical protein